MKHFYISLFIFATVIVTGFFADYTRKKEFDILCASAEQISVQPEIRQAEIQVKSMKKRFYDKKNMLMLITSKEHIKDIPKFLRESRNLTNGLKLLPRKEELLKPEIL